MGLQSQVDKICLELKINNEEFIEIEQKRKLHLEQYAGLREFLKKHSYSFEKPVSFFDQYLDTKDLAIAKKGASLRVRYKQDGAKVYIQYKGPGFLQKGILFRSEFNSGKLPGIVLKGGHHNFVYFKEKNLKNIVKNYLPEEMASAMKKHLGRRIMAKTLVSNLVCFYRKEKFLVKKNNIFLEPSLDKIYSFCVRGNHIYPMATFCEYENEIKAKNDSLTDKLENLPFLSKFDETIESKFDLPVEREDKYHRCLSLFEKSLSVNSSKTFTLFSRGRKK